MRFFPSTRILVLTLLAALVFFCLQAGRSFFSSHDRAHLFPLLSAAWSAPGTSSSQNTEPLNASADNDLPAEKSLLHGVDISSYAHEISADVWQMIHTDGWDFVIASAWQGRHQNRFARRQLEGARLAGMKTAAYCLLNFDRPQESGEWQVQQAVQALGSEPVSFLAIDVELPRRFKLTVNRVERIRQAVDAAKRAGLRPVIYASREDWKRITRDADNPNGTDQFRELALWGARWDEDDRLTLDRYEEWQAYGGWDSRVGKQYADNTSFSAEMFQFRYNIPSVDLNVFDAALFREQTVAIHQPTTAPSAQQITALKPARGAPMTADTPAVCL